MLRIDFKYLIIVLSFNVPSDKTLGFIRISDNNPTIIPTYIPFTDVYDVFYYNNPPSFCDIPLLKASEHRAKFG